jgi:hypothetical protein
MSPTAADDSRERDVVATRKGEHRSLNAARNAPAYLLALPSEAYLSIH